MKRKTVFLYKYVYECWLDMLEEDFALFDFFLINFNKNLFKN